jgi:hypothetical protein
MSLEIGDTFKIFDSIWWRTLVLKVMRNSEIPGLMVVALISTDKPMAGDPPRYLMPKKIEVT